MAFLQRISVWLVFLVCVVGGVQSTTHPPTSSNILDNSTVSEFCGEMQYATNQEITSCKITNNDTVEKIAAMAFVEYGNLTEFRMENTTLRDVDDAAFCGTRIKTLTLSKSHLSEVPNVICINDTLMHLDLSDNDILHINSSLAYLPVLETLNMSNNRLEYAAHDSLCGTKLTILRLNKNRLTTTLNFGCLHEMSTVEMFENDIHTIPDDSFKNVTITVQLRMEYNNLDNVSALVELAESPGCLNLTGNNLACFNGVSLSLKLVSVSSISIIMIYILRIFIKVVLTC